MSKHILWRFLGGRSDISTLHYSTATARARKVRLFLSGSALLASLLHGELCGTFSADASELLPDIALQLCQVLQITLIDLRFQVPHRVKSSGGGGSEGAMDDSPPADDAVAKCPSSQARVSLDV